MQVITQVPLTALGICAARSDGIDHTALVPMPVPIVPDAFPKEYVSVCVNESAARFKLTVTLDPISALVVENVGVVARGIDINVTVWDF